MHRHYLSVFIFFFHNMTHKVNYSVINLNQVSVRSLSNICLNEELGWNQTIPFKIAHMSRWVMSDVVKADYHNLLFK